jgi:hypothetical protein
MRSWLCVFSNGTHWSVLARSLADAFLNATELYGSRPVNVFPEGDW